MKRVISCLLAVMLMLTLAMPVAMAADERTSGAFTYRIKGNGTAAITGYDWNSMKEQDIYIPRMLDGYTVTEIAEEAFATIEYNNNSFPSVNGSFNKVGNLVIPDTITTIGGKAFWGIEFETKTITIPTSVEYIGAGAFSNIQGVEQFVVAPQNNVYATIDGVLYNKRDKTLLAFPPEKVIAYKEKSYIAEFAIPNGIKRIEDYAFFGIHYKSKDGIVDTSGIAFPSTLEAIGNFAFAYGLGRHFRSDNLVEVVFPSTLSELGIGAFYQCQARMSVIDMSASQIEKIEPYTFYACNFHTLNENILFPFKLRSIGKYSFSDIEQWGKMVIPASVVEIDSYAFANSFAFPTTNIGFSSDSELRIIEEGAFSSNLLTGTFILPKKLEKIGEFAFVNCEELERLVLPASITSIGDQFCDRLSVYLEVEPGSYAALYASENGYMTVTNGVEDTSWLND